MGAHPAQDITGLLVDWSDGGDRQALDKLLPLMYAELHRLARGQLRRERPDHTLQATALINEAYLRLVDQRRVQWRNRVHFLGLAAQMMRRILIDHARAHRYAKRGGGAAKLSLADAPEVAADGRLPDVLEVDEALTELAELDPELARIVELRFFVGLKGDEIAEVLGISVPTVTRRWRLAKAWLYRQLGGNAHGP